MNDLPCNYGDKTNCKMGCFEEILKNEHLLNCPYLNQDTNKENIKDILNGSNAQKKKILIRMNKNNQRRIEYLRDSVNNCYSTVF